MGRPTNGYWVGGKRVPSVTTVLGNCKIGGVDPLLAWANRMGLEGIDYRDARGKAADAGTAAHDMIEAYVKGYEFNPEPYTYESLDTAKPCFDAFQEWASQTNLKVVQSEVSLTSERYGYGGTFDALAVNGQLVIGDWKTSSGVYPDMIIQLAAYKQLWEENYPDQPIEGGAYILRVSKQKEDGDPVAFHHHHWSHVEQGWEAFEHMLDLYRLHKRLKGVC